MHRDTTHETAAIPKHSSIPQPNKNCNRIFVSFRHRRRNRHDNESEEVSSGIVVAVVVIVSVVKRMGRPCRFRFRLLLPLLWCCSRGGPKHSLLLMMMMTMMTMEDSTHRVRHRRRDRFRRFHRSNVDCTVPWGRRGSSDDCVRGGWLLSVVLLLCCVGLGCGHSQQRACDQSRQSITKP